ncbi:hypothetical protein ACLI1A_05060 [Flavobacterium sp. RHBU_3]|uniref:hypothetical protein n=1 Tax=Flavobacterium sp. RHBU_3 TaxID=3391184 RepID=UPI0039851CC0
MIRELNQNTVFIKRKIIIEETKVVIHINRFGKEMGVSIPYEDITAHITPFTSEIKDIKVLIGAFTLSSLIAFTVRNEKDVIPYIWMILAGFMVATCIFHFLYKEEVWRLRIHNNSNIFINIKKPSKVEVDEFIEELFNQRQRYLRETYLRITKNLSYELQLNSLNSLKANEVITPKEYQEFLAELDALFNDYKKPIEFFLN